MTRKCKECGFDVERFVRDGLTLHNCPNPEPSRKQVRDLALALRSEGKTTREIATAIGYSVRYTQRLFQVQSRKVGALLDRSIVAERSTSVRPTGGTEVSRSSDVPPSRQQIGVDARLDVVTARKRAGGTEVNRGK